MKIKEVVTFNKQELVILREALQPINLIEPTDEEAKTIGRLESIANKEVIGDSVAVLRKLRTKLLNDLRDFGPGGKYKHQENRPTGKTDKVPVVMDKGHMCIVICESRGTQLKRCESAINLLYLASTALIGTRFLYENDDDQQPSMCIESVLEFMELPAS